MSHNFKSESNSLESFFLNWDSLHASWMGNIQVWIRIFNKRRVTRKSQRQKWEAYKKGNKKNHKDIMCLLTLVTKPSLNLCWHKWLKQKIIFLQDHVYF